MALDKDATKDSLFGGLKKTAKHAPAEETIVVQPSPAPSASITTQDPATAPKWQQLDKVTVLLTAEEKEGIDRIARRLMKHRSNALKGKQDKERITANSLIRCLIDVFLEKEESLELEIITSENEVREWVRKVFK